MGASGPQDGSPAAQGRPPPSPRSQVRGKFVHLQMGEVCPAGSLEGCLLPPEMRAHLGTDNC